MSDKSSQNDDLIEILYLAMNYRPGKFVLDMDVATLLKKRGIDNKSMMVLFFLLSHYKQYTCDMRLEITIPSRFL
jgi:hypothetical protein